MENRKDLFENKVEQRIVNLNIYADEIQSKLCPLTGDRWHYIGLIIEDLGHHLLDEIINERFKGNFDESFPYFLKNNKEIHWVDIRDADRRNICERWFKYILAPQKSRKSFYCHILGLNNSKLNKEEFDLKDEFNSKYNRFFRSAVLCPLKNFFPGTKIIVHNIFHEVGQQEKNYFFPWHCIYKLQDKEPDIIFNCDKIIFLPKSHIGCKESNLIQLCDCILGASTSLIHGIKKSNRSEYREELCELYFPLLDRIMNRPNNKNSSYQYYRRITISFFPKVKTSIDDYRRLTDQFYTRRDIQFIIQRSGQGNLFDAVPK